MSMTHSVARVTLQQLRPFSPVTVNSPPSLLSHFSQRFLVAKAMFLDKLENKVQIHHLYIKSFHMEKRL